MIKLHLWQRYQRRINCRQGIGQTRPKVKSENPASLASPGALISLFLGLSEVIFNPLKMALNGFCMLVFKHSAPKFKQSSAVRMVILIYFRTGKRHLKMMKSLPRHNRYRVAISRTDAAPIPVTFLPILLQKFAIIKSRAE